MDRDPNLALPGRFGEEDRLATVGLDEMDVRCTHARENEAWKAGTAPHIDQRRVRITEKSKELAAVEDVPSPGIGERRRADEIDPRIPALEERQVPFEPAQRFT